MSSTTKKKKSFTLSPSSIVFLERLKRERKGASASLILDELIRQAEAWRRRRTTEEAISAFYDSLSEEERKEEAAWGEFARNQWREEGLDRLNPGWKSFAVAYALPSGDFELVCGSMRNVGRAAPAAATSPEWFWAMPRA